MMVMFSLADSVERSDAAGHVKKMKEMFTISDALRNKMNLIQKNLRRFFKSYIEGTDLFNENLIDRLESDLSQLKRIIPLVANIKEAIPM